MCAATNKFQEVSRDRPNQYNWDAGQIGPPQEIENYLETAEKLTGHMDAYTRELSNILDIDVSVMPASTKSVSSALRKLTDGTVGFVPEKIKDYLRTTITVPNTGPQSITDLKKVVEHLRHAPETIGFKDQFAEPHPETGFRSFKVHTLIQNPENPSENMVAEIIVQHAGMEQANELTKMLRTMERRLREVSSGSITSQFSAASARLSISEAGVRQARKDIHDETARRAGLNELLDPKVRQHHQCDITAALERITTPRKPGIKGISKRVEDAFSRAFNL